MFNDRQIGQRCRRTSSIAAAMVGLVTGSCSLIVAAPELAAQQAAKNVVFTQPTYSSPIALSADNQLVWSVNPDDNSVSVVRTDTNALVRTIRVGKEPQSVALAPNNKFAFVANAAANSVTVIKINNPNVGGFAAVVEKTIRTGAEPWNIVISPNGKRVFVANSGQDTISVIDAVTRNLIGNVRLRSSLCNEGDGARHFQPRGLAVSLDSKQLYVTRFLSFTKPVGVQGDDDGKQGVVCRIDINTAAPTLAGYKPAAVIPLPAQATGFTIGDPIVTRAPNSTAFPNQLQSIVLRGTRGYLPNIAASPESPLQFQNSTQAYVNVIDGVGGATQTSLRGIEPAPGRTGPRGRQEEAVLCQPLGHRLHHAERCRHRLRHLRRQRSAGQAQRRRVRQSELHRRRADHALHRPQRSGRPGDQRRQCRQEPARDRDQDGWPGAPRLRRQLRLAQHLRGRPHPGQGDPGHPDHCPAAAGLGPRAGAGRGGDVLLGPRPFLRAARTSPSRRTSACRRTAGRTAPAATSRA